VIHGVKRVLSLGEADLLLQIVFQIKVCWNHMSTGGRSVTFHLGGQVDEDL
jgi:hypothetical protein